MAVFQIDIQQNIGTEQWTNVYHADGADMEAILTALFPLLLTQHRAAHYENVTINKALVRPFPLVSGSYTELPLNVNGTREGLTDLPLFNVARILFVAFAGKAGVKMYRGALNEGGIEALGNLTAAERAFWEDWGTDTLAALPSLCKEDGTRFADINPSPRVGMRQLRRGSKKKVI